MSEALQPDPTDETPTESPADAPQEPASPVDALPDGGSVPEPSDEPLEDGETFPRDYVEKLRKESAGYRDRAKRADDLAARLHTALVDATGRLADSRDLPFDEAHLSDPEALQTAIQSLLTERPHLASRKPMGDIGQGATSEPEAFGLGGLLRAHAS